MKYIYSRKRIETRFIYHGFDPEKFDKNQVKQSRDDFDTLYEELSEGNKHDRYQLLLEIFNKDTFEVTADTYAHDTDGERPVLIQKGTPVKIADDYVVQKNGELFVSIGKNKDRHDFLIPASMLRRSKAASSFTLPSSSGDAVPEIFESDVAYTRDDRTGRVRKNTKTAPTTPSTVSPSVKASPIVNRLPRGYRERSPIYGLGKGSTAILNPDLKWSSCRVYSTLEEMMKPSSARTRSDLLNPGESVKILGVITAPNTGTRYEIQTSDGNIHYMFANRGSDGTPLLAQSSVRATAVEKAVVSKKKTPAKVAVKPAAEPKNEKVVPEGDAMKKPMTRVKDPLPKVSKIKTSEKKVPKGYEKAEVILENLGEVQIDDSGARPRSYIKMEDGTEFDRQETDAEVGTSQKMTFAYSGYCFRVTGDGKVYVNNSGVDTKFVELEDASAEGIQEWIDTSFDTAVKTRTNVLQFENAVGKSLEWNEDNTFASFEIDGITFTAPRNATLYQEAGGLKFTSEDGRYDIFVDSSGRLFFDDNQKKDVTDGSLKEKEREPLRKSDLVAKIKKRNKETVTENIKGKREAVLHQDFGPSSLSTHDHGVGGPLALKIKFKYNGNDHCDFVAQDVDGKKVDLDHEGPLLLKYDEDGAYMIKVGVDGKLEVSSDGGVNFSMKTAKELIGWGKSVFDTQVGKENAAKYKKIRERKLKQYGLDLKKSDDAWQITTQGGIVFTADKNKKLDQSDDLVFRYNSYEIRTTIEEEVFISHPLVKNDVKTRGVDESNVRIWDTEDVDKFIGETDKIVQKNLEKIKRAKEVSEAQLDLALIRPGYEFGKALYIAGKIFRPNEEALAADATEYYFKTEYLDTPIEIGVQIGKRGINIKGTNDFYETEEDLKDALVAKKDLLKENKQQENRAVIATTIGSLAGSEYALGTPSVVIDGVAFTRDGDDLSFVGTYQPEGGGESSEISLSFDIDTSVPTISEDGGKEGETAIKEYIGKEKELADTRAANVDRVERSIAAAIGTPETKYKLGVELNFGEGIDKFQYEKIGTDGFEYKARYKGQEIIISGNIDESDPVTFDVSGINEYPGFTNLKEAIATEIEAIDTKRAQEEKVRVIFKNFGLAEASFAVIDRDGYFDVDVVYGATQFEVKYIPESGECIFEGNTYSDIETLKQSIEAAKARVDAHQVHKQEVYNFVNSLPDVAFFSIEYPEYGSIVFNRSDGFTFTVRPGDPMVFDYTDFEGVRKTDSNQSNFTQHVASYVERKERHHDDLDAAKGLINSFDGVNGFEYGNTFEVDGLNFKNPTTQDQIGEGDSIYEFYYKDEFGFSITLGKNPQYSYYDKNGVRKLTTDKEDILKRIKEFKTKEAKRTKSQKNAASEVRPSEVMDTEWTKIVYIAESIDKDYIDGLSSGLVSFEGNKITSLNKQSATALGKKTKLMTLSLKGLTTTLNADVVKALAPLLSREGSKVFVTPGLKIDGYTVDAATGKLEKMKMQDSEKFNTAKKEFLTAFGVSEGKNIDLNGSSFAPHTGIPRFSKERYPVIYSIPNKVFGEPYYFGVTSTGDVFLGSAASGGLSLYPFEPDTVVGMKKVIESKLEDNKKSLHNKLKGDVVDLLKELGVSPEQNKLVFTPKGFLDYTFLLDGTHEVTVDLDASNPNVYAFSSGGRTFVGKHFSSRAIGGTPFEFEGKALSTEDFNKILRGKLLPITMKPTTPKMEGTPEVVGESLEIGGFNIGLGESVSVSKIEKIENGIWKLKLNYEDFIGFNEEASVQFTISGNTVTIDPSIKFGFVDGLLVVASEGIDHTASHTFVSQTPSTTMSPPVTEGEKMKVFEFASFNPEIVIEDLENTYGGKLKPGHRLTTVDVNGKNPIDLSVDDVFRFESPLRSRDAEGVRYYEVLINNKSRFIPLDLSFGGKADEHIPYVSGDDVPIEYGTVTMDDAIRPYTVDPMVTSSSSSPELSAYPDIVTVAGAPNIGVSKVVKELLDSLEISLASFSTESDYPTPNLSGKHSQLILKKKDPDNESILIEVGSIKSEDGTPFDLKALNAALETKLKNIQKEREEPDEVTNLTQGYARILASPTLAPTGITIKENGVTLDETGSKLSVVFVADLTALGSAYPAMMEKVIDDLPNIETHIKDFMTDKMSALLGQGIMIESLAVDSDTFEVTTVFAEEGESSFGMALEAYEASKPADWIEVALNEEVVESKTYGRILKQLTGHPKRTEVIKKIKILRTSDSTESQKDNAKAFIIKIINSL